MQAEGKETGGEDIMGNVMKHDYLRRSMEQRLQRNALFEEYRNAQKNLSNYQPHRQTHASHLRSQSVIKANEDLSNDQKKRFDYISQTRNEEFRAMKERLNQLEQANLKMFNQQNTMDYGDVQKLPQKIRMMESFPNLPIINEDDNQNKKKDMKTTV